MPSTNPWQANRKFSRTSTAELFITTSSLSPSGQHSILPSITYGILTRMSPLPYISLSSPHLTTSHVHSNTHVTIASELTRMTSAMMNPHQNGSSYPDPTCLSPLEFVSISFLLYWRSSATTDWYRKPSSIHVTSPWYLKEVWLYVVGCPHGFSPERWVV